MGKFKKLQEDIENVTNKEVVKQTRISGVATIVLIISVACAIGGMSLKIRILLCRHFCLPLRLCCF